MALALLNFGRVEPKENDLGPRHLLTIREATALLAVTPRVIRGMIECKELPALKVRSQWRVRPNKPAK